MDTPSSNPGSSEPNPYSIRRFRMPDAVWEEVAKHLPEDAKNRTPLLRDWIEGAGSPGLTGDTELHLHLFRAIIMAVQESAARIDKNLYLFLEAQAAAGWGLAENAATIASKLPGLSNAADRIEAATAQAAADRDSLIRQLEAEREERAKHCEAEWKEHAETMQMLKNTIVSSHRDLHENRITPMLNIMFSMPDRLDSLELTFEGLRRMILWIIGSVLVGAVVVGVLVLLPP